MTLVNVSELPWQRSSPRRNQAIFKDLLRCHDELTEGLYVTPTPDAERSGMADYLALPSIEQVDEFTHHGKKVVVVRPICLTAFSGRAPLTQMLCRSIANRLQKQFLSPGKPGETVKYWLWMNNAELFSYWISRSLAPGAALRTFDASDDFAAFRHLNPAAFRERLRQLIQLSDQVLCVNTHVAEGINHPRKLVFPNCTNFEELAGQPADGLTLAPVYPKPEGATYIGFIGGLHEGRADVELLTTLFTRFPEFRFIFVGYSNSQQLLAELKRHQNFLFLPEVPYEQLGTVIKGFDVAIVPHLDNEMTKGNDLLKALDYLACGIPLVTTDCSNIRQYGSAVYVAKSAQEFGDYIERLVGGALVHDRRPGQEIARERSWQARVPALLHWLSEKG